MLFEQGLLFPALRTRLRRLPWLLSIFGIEVVYLLIIAMGALIAGSFLVVSGLSDESLADALLLEPWAILYAMLVSTALVVLIRMRDLIGADAFRNILLGRYHRPVEEERVFVFLDLIGSTSYAQTHGDIKAQEFLRAIFAALADPVRSHGGAIDDYIGDMALITWRMKAGVSDGRCIASVLFFLESISNNAEAWKRDHGQVPAFRAAFHGGKVVTAEVGIDRHKIAYFGDAVNTTGRIEALCKSLNAPFLISADLLDRIPVLPEGVLARSLGSYELRGRGQQLIVHSLVFPSPASDKERLQGT